MISMIRVTVWEGGVAPKDVGMAIHLKRREWQRLLGKRKGPVKFSSSFDPKFSEKEVGRKAGATLQKGQKLDLYFYDMKRAVERNQTDLAADAIKKLSAQPIRTSLRGLRTTFRVASRLRRYIGHPNKTVSCAVQKCLSRWKIKTANLESGDLAVDSDPATDEMASQCEEAEESRSPSSSSSHGFAHTHDCIIHVDGVGNITRNQTANSILESIRYWQKADNIRKVMRNSDMNIREGIRVGKYMASEICHMNIEKVYVDEEENLRFILERKRRKEKIALIREEHEKKKEAAMLNITV
eukprot:jgi/Bigna1/132832/aug1.19_g7540